MIRRPPSTPQSRSSAASDVYKRQDDLDADSLDLFELVMAFEEAYNVEIPSEDLEKLETVGDVMDYIRDKEIDA